LKAKSKKYALIAIIIVVLTVSGVFIGFLNGLVQNAGEFTPHYLSYMDEPSKIYIASASTLKITANQTYQIHSGQEIVKGAELLQLTLSLRNDYSIENPPPPTSNIPVAPVDGTAYLTLTVTLYNKNGAFTPIILSPSDFAVTSSNQLGLVMASAQTNKLTLMLAANSADINRFEINLVFLGDSI
jgi:hypothetical protein